MTEGLEDEPGIPWDEFKREVEAKRTLSV